MLGFLARHFGSVFVLALAQRAEARSTYDTDVDATPTMAADERIHLEVVRALATRGRNQLSGSFRAAVFGANDGLVSNLALVLGISATGVTSHTVLATGLAGLLAGALSMGAGEYVSVNSQRELLEASTPSPEAGAALPQLDVNANELALVYRARGMSVDDATRHAAKVLDNLATGGRGQLAGPDADRHEAVGTGLRAAVSSFSFFASGALIPVLPYLFGLEGTIAVVVAAGLVGIALLATGIVVGLLSGGPPVRRALRQLMIGYGAATVTYLLGLLFGTGAG
jgi:VIT1/CCC1 family predicted Fe2+/Mn2+ transporter